MNIKRHVEQRQTLSWANLPTRLQVRRRKGRAAVIAIRLMPVRIPGANPTQLQALALANPQTQPPTPAARTPKRRRR